MATGKDEATVPLRHCTAAWWPVVGRLGTGRLDVSGAWLADVVSLRRELGDV